MNAPCARCKKTVYPVEKLSCLDKIWHKGCFTCETCNLKLTMKTYKGYNKLPYCNTHYPTTKFTAVADTPENKRLAKQTQDQSCLQYHKDHKQSQIRASQDSEPTSEDRQQNARQAYMTQPNAPAQHAPPHHAPAHHAPPQHSVQPPAPPQYQMEPVDYNPESELETALGSVWRGAVQAAPYEPPQPRPGVPVPQPQTSSAPKYMALYDYAAADEDEVSFNEGDRIIDVTIIDDGWMEGRVERTGQYGMLPSNYVEKR